MAIKVNTTIFNTLVSIMKSAIFTKSEMRNVESITWYLTTIKMTEVSDWIKANKVEYLTGLLEGFIIDNSQEAQLKDLNTEINL